MRQSVCQRLVVVLGMVAMLGGLIAVPASTMAAVHKTIPAVADAHDGMPCDQPCPDCPKSCDAQALCLLKCFKPYAPLPASIVIGRSAVGLLRLPAPASVLGDALVPPLLRPPSA